MADKKLSTLLEELHITLDATKAVDEKGRELLRALNEGAGAEDSLLDRMRETQDYFQNTHPEFTSALSNLLTTLNNAGI